MVSSHVLGRFGEWLKYANHLSGKPFCPINRYALQPDFILSVIHDDLVAVDAQIRGKLGSDVPLVRTIAEHIIRGGGKRLRPALVVLAARSLGYRATAHVTLAAVVEFIHTATLLHDDVVDESELRRGNKTANAQFGNAASVLVGDFLYSRAFQMMVSVGEPRVMEVLADATNAIAEGEVMQLLATHNADVGEDEYRQIIQRKTAKLFEAAAQIGSIVSGGSAADEAALARYGLHLGTAFQLIDDVLDYSGDAETTGKNLGDDLREGKPTLPLIRVMQHGKHEQVAVVRRAIEQGGSGGFVDVLDAVRATGALEYAEGAARRESEQAIGALAQLPRSVYRDCLIELAEFAVKRDH